MENNSNFETRKPPVATTGILGWCRQHLFSNWVNSFITLLVKSINTLVFRLVCI